MSSGYIPAKDEPGPDEIGEALREAVFENPIALCRGIGPCGLLEG